MYSSLRALRWSALVLGEILYIYDWIANQAASAMPADCIPIKKIYKQMKRLFWNMHFEDFEVKVIAPHRIPKILKMQRLFRNMHFQDVEVTLKERIGQV